MDMTEWFQQYAQAWNRHSAQDVVQWMNPDAVYTDTTLGETLRGHGEISRFVDRLAETFSSDYRFEVTNAFATDTQYAAEWTILGTHDRTDGQLPATGKPFRVQGVSVGSLREGKISENRDYWNMADFMMQVGLLPRAEPGSQQPSYVASPRPAGG